MVELLADDEHSCGRRCWISRPRPSSARVRDSHGQGRYTKKVIQGAVNFFRPFPGGNGRSCATCHNPADGFSLSPATVEARWRRLQRARLRNPEATDPLFRPIDADDGQDDFTLLRTRALVKVRVPLPSRVRLTLDPAATEVTLSRAVTPLNMLKHTAPYQQDRSAATLEAQALGAVNQHMEPTVPPTKEFLETVAEFQRHIFSSAKVRKTIGGDRCRPSAAEPRSAADGDSSGRGRRSSMTSAAGVTAGRRR